MEVGLPILGGKFPFSSCLKSEHAPPRPGDPQPHLLIKTWPTCLHLCCWKTARQSSWEEQANPPPPPQKKLVGGNDQTSGGIDSHIAFSFFGYRHCLQASFDSKRLSRVHYFLVWVRLIEVCVLFFELPKFSVPFRVNFMSSG